MKIVTANPSLLNRIGRAWQRRSVGEFFGLLADNLRVVLAGKYKAKHEAYDRSFDRSSGLDTAGREDPAYLSTDETLNAHACAYEPIAEARMKALMALAAVDHPSHTFIDFGSGKGKALILASDYPFKRIIGVEYSPALHEVAVENIRKFPPLRCKDIQSVCADAATLDIPEGPILALFNNPFDETVMVRVVENLERAVKRGQSVTIAYLNTEHPEPIDASSCWKCTDRAYIAGMPFAIWRS